MWIPVVGLRKRSKANYSEWQRTLRQFACWSMELISLCEMLKQNLSSEEFFFYPKHQNVCATKTKTYW
jgi:hypothetical protein